MRFSARIEPERAVLRILRSFGGYRNIFTGVAGAVAGGKDGGAYRFFVFNISAVAVVCGVNIFFIRKY